MEPTRVVAALLSAVVAAAGVGCSHPALVERAYGGDVLDGHYVSPEAYAAFLRGAMAEAEGHTADALRAYGEAADRDGASPEPWTRMAEMQCVSGGRQGADRAEADLAHALALDPGYARAWTVRGVCAALRGDVAVQRAAAARATEIDPLGDRANILLARAGDAETGSELARQILVALTVTARDPVAAWDALASWAEAHGDVALWTRAMVELVRRAPERRELVAQSAETLAAAGSIGEARAVAAAALESSDEPLSPRLALAVRLAIDECIARRDLSALLRRTARGRLSFDEVAGRALLGGERALARRLASTQAAADPGAFGARLVLAAVDGSDLPAVLGSARSGDSPASAAAVVAFGVALSRASPSADSRSALASAPRLPIVAGDDRLVRSAVDLVLQGILPVSVLPAGGLLELAAIHPTVNHDPVAAEDSALDVRHRFLALALTEPVSPKARALGERLRGVAASDPVVAAAAGLLLLAASAPPAPDAARALLARNPADPLLAAITVRLAERLGDTDVERKARETLNQLAGSAIGGGGPVFP